MTDKILTRVENHIGWVIYNNAEKRNAVSLAMAEAAADAYASMNEDDGVRVIVVTGAGGKSFVSGQDISEFEALRSNPENTKHYEATTDRMYQGLRDCSKATIAMIPGFCFGGGVALACACDFRICSDDAIFAIPAARLGIAYRPNFSRWVADVVGPSTAKEILLTGRRYDAEEMHRLGLVNRIVAKDDLEDFVTDYASTIAGNAPLSVTANKLIINEVSQHPGDWDQDYCIDLMQSCSNSDDYTEGRRAFMEKRSPKFKGA